MIFGMPAFLPSGAAALACYSNLPLIINMLQLRWARKADVLLRTLKYNVLHTQQEELVIWRTWLLIDTFSSSLFAGMWQTHKHKKGSSLDSWTKLSQCFKMCHIPALILILNLSHEERWLKVLQPSTLLQFFSSIILLHFLTVKPEACKRHRVLDYACPGLCCSRDYTLVSQMD